jgi:hypothetical protein
MTFDSEMLTWLRLLCCVLHVPCCVCCCCQLEESENRPNAAQTVYASGLKRCPDCAPMWRAAARLEEAQGNVGRARALLEQVCLVQYPASPLCVIAGGIKVPLAAFTNE